MLIDTVLNTDTKNTIRWVLRRNGIASLPAWPGFTASAGQEAFDALLGTPNNISVAWLLINHASALSKLTVKTITVFQGPTEAMMDFELGKLK